MNNFEQKQSMTQEQLSLLESEMEKQQKSMLVAFLLWIFLGAFGAQRFYLGYTGYAVCLILFGWLTLGIWPLVDAFFIPKNVNKHNEETEEKLIMKIKTMSM